MVLQVTGDKIEIPEKFRDAEGMVIRTPYLTVETPNSFQTFLDGNYLRLVTIEHFQNNDGTVENPQLLPNKITFKEYGEESEEYEVELSSE